MNDAKGFQHQFAELMKLREDLAGRVAAAAGGDAAALGKQRLGEAEERLDQLHRERARVDAEIAGAERQLQDVRRLLERINPDDGTSKPAEASKSGKKAKAASRK